MYLSLDLTNKQAIEDLARLVAMANVLEGLCCVLATYVKEYFLTAARYSC